MKHQTSVLTPNNSTPSRRTVERSPQRDAATGCLHRLTLGGALCGGFAGSFAGAVLGMAVGAVCSDLSLGLDGALLGGLLATGAGAVYGLLVALRERKGSAQIHDVVG